MMNPTTQDKVREALEKCHSAFASWQIGQVPGRPDDILKLKQDVLEALSLLSAPVETEPVAWMRGIGPSADYVSHTTRSTYPERWEEYTIPLFTHPPPQDMDKMVEKVMEVVNAEVSHEPDRWRVHSRLQSLFTPNTEKK